MDITPEQEAWKPEQGAERKARFAKAFVGVFGSPEWVRPYLKREPKLPPGTSTSNLIASDNFAVRMVGTSRPTIDERVPGRCLMVLKGRPFALKEGTLGLISGEDGGHEVVDEALSHLDGKFALCSVGGDRLVLATDLLGIGPLYYSISNQGILFSSHLALLVSMLPAAPSLSRLGVASLLISRGQLLAETHFEGVYRLRDGERLMARRHGATTRSSVSRYADVTNLVSADHPQRGNALEQISDLLDEAIARHPLGNKAALMLSGGRDSKAIALAMKSPCDAVTFGRPYSSDLIGGRSLAARLGRPHHTIPYHSWTFETYADQIVGLQGGAAGLQVSHKLVAADWAASHYDAVLMGFLGDCLTGKFLGDEPWFHRGIFPNLSADDVNIRYYFDQEIKELEHMIDSQIKELQSNIDEPRKATMIMNMKQKQRGFNSTSLDILEWFIDVAHTFYHRGLIKFWLSRQFEDLQHRRLYDTWLAFAEQRHSAGLSRLVKTRAALPPTLQRLARGAAERIWPRAADFAKPVPYRGVTRRSQQWLKQIADSDGDQLAQITQESLDYVIEHPAEIGIPVFCQTVPILLATREFRRDQTDRAA